MNNLNAFVFRYGKVMTAYIFLTVGAWILGMILLPQFLMLDYSFWAVDEVAQARAMTQVDQLETELDTLDAQIRKAQAGMKTATVEERAALEEKIQSLEAKAADLEGQFAPLDKVIADPPRRYGLKNYAYLANNTLHRSIFFKTMVVSLSVTIVAFMLCYPIAYYLAQAVAKGTATVVFIGLITPYWVNEILRTFAWLMMLSQNGLINLALQWVGLTDAPVDFLNNNSGVVIGMVYCYVLFMVFPIYNTLDTLDHNQIEAARDLGAGWWRIHARIAIPHAKPGIAVGCIMTFMVAAGTYAVPSILGGTSSLWFTQVIYSWFFDGGNWNQGSAYAFVLLVLCIAFIMSMTRLFKVRLEDIAK